MSRLFYHIAQDNVGNLLFGVSGTMRLAGTSTLATIYGDEALTAILPNPMTNHPSFGSFKCFLGVGDYDFYMAKSGYTFETLTGVQGSGTMADQNAGAVAITGGTAGFNTLLVTGGVTLPDYSGNDVAALSSTMSHAGGTNRYFLNHSGNGHTRLGGNVGVRVNPAADVALNVFQPRSSGFYGLVMQPDTDAGLSNISVQFRNAAATAVGSITTTAAATAYNTSSDVRLKHAVEALTGALDVVRALRPVSFRWNADDSPGVGFLAHEVAAHVPGVITGEAGAVHPDGTINPQQIDYSKLVPFLVGAIQTLAARVAVLEDALGA